MDNRKRPSSDTKLVARHAISAFGAPPSVWRFTCEREEFSLDIGGCADRPMAGVVSYTTIGLSDFGVVTGPESPAHVELAAVCASDQPLFPNILAAAAMLLVRQRKEVKAGQAIRDVVAEFYPRATVSHLYLTRPFLWGERLQMLRGAEKNITWFLAVPVTSGELLCLETQGGGGKNNCAPVYPHSY
ncbi:MAG: suppressor of fused domain protein, partial [Thermoguttaceae bacterium]